MAFRLIEYEKLLKNLAASGRPFRTVADFLIAPDNKSVVLRHDVDRWVGRSLAMARSEYQKKVASSYYFRYRSGFPAKIIREIKAMGHEVGFHYETLSDAKGDPHIALTMFLNQLDEFRLCADCQTICAHGRPLSQWFSGDMAGTFLGAADGLIGDASATMPEDFVVYLTDAGGRWNDTTVNLRDKVGVMPVGLDPLNEKSLAQILGKQKSLYISTHPEGWCDNSINLAARSSFELVAGLIKLILRKIRNH
jgi:hypothetical protein